MTNIANLKNTDVRTRSPLTTEVISHCPLCHGRLSIKVAMTNVGTFRSCVKCGLLYQTPRPTSASLKSMYDVGLSRWSDQNGYELIRKAFFSQILDLLGTRFPQPGRLLDFGCGIGTFMLQAGDRGWETDGVDTSMSDVRSAQQRGLNAFECDITGGFPSPRTDYDLIVMLDVLEHLIDPVATLLHLRQLLNADGRLFIQTGNAGPLGGALLGGRNPFLHHEGHVCVFSKRSIETLFARTGFQPDEIVDETYFEDTNRSFNASAVFRRLRRNLSAAPDILAFGAKEPF